MNAVIKQLKPRKCRNPDCKIMYTPHSTLSRACSPQCALELVYIKKKKKEDQDFARRKKNLKTLKEWTKDAQDMFNKFIRFRDKDFPCISCQRRHAGQYHAGHYRSVGACVDLRFNEDNCHKQCSACNKFLSGNTIEYRINLVDKIGLDRVVELEGPQEPKHYRIIDIQGIREIYRLKIKEMAKELLIFAD